MKMSDIKTQKRLIFDGKEWVNTADHEEVVTTCVKLRARIVELEGVLLPFLNEAPRWWGGGMGLKDTPTQLTIGDYKAVSEAFMDFDAVTLPTKGSSTGDEDG